MPPKTNSKKTELDKNLFIMCHNGNLSKVQELIAAGADVNKGHSADGNTPLIAAAEHGHLKVVEQLIAANADVNKAQPRNGITPLYAACIWGHLTIVERLIAAGADVNKARTTNGSTPLYATISSGSTPNYQHIVERLIVSGADVNKARTNDGSTPLNLACSTGNETVVERLIAAGADVNNTTTDEFGMTCIYRAAQNGYLNIVEQLIAAGADINKPITYNGATPLYAASRYGHFEIVERLLAAGADKNIRARDSTLPIDVAKTHQIRLLLNGSSPNLINATTLNTIDIPVPNVTEASNALMGDLAEDNVVGYFPNSNGKIFASQGITAYRKADPKTPTNLWRGALASKKNPFTRQAFTGAPVYRRAHLVKTEGGYFSRRRGQRINRTRRRTRKHNHK